MCMREVGSEYTAPSGLLLLGSWRHLTPQYTLLEHILSGPYPPPRPYCECVDAAQKCFWYYHEVNVCIRLQPVQTGSATLRCSVLLICQNLTSLGIPLTFFPRSKVSTAKYFSLLLVQFFHLFPTLTGAAEGKKISQSVFTEGIYFSMEVAERQFLYIHAYI